MSVATRKEYALRQLLRLVDLSRDLERNLDDSNFAAAGGEIVYVLDENIFEIFVRPFRHTESVETFYSDIWNPIRRSDPAWRSFEAQAALVTSEFLLSQNLPGSLQGIISMTAPHRWELAHRIEELTSEYRSKIDRDDDQQLKQDLVKKFTAIAALIAQEETDNGPPSQNPVLESDVEKLSRESPRALQRFRAARVAAEVSTLR